MRKLLEEMAHQVFGTSRPNPGKYYRKVMHEVKQAAFENKRAYEIAQARAKSKGWK